MIGVRFTDDAYFFCTFFTNCLSLFHYLKDGHSYIHIRPVRASTVISISTEFLNYITSPTIVIYVRDPTGEFPGSFYYIHCGKGHNVYCGGVCGSHALESPVFCYHLFPLYHLEKRKRHAEWIEITQNSFSIIWQLVRSCYNKHPKVPRTHCNVIINAFSRQDHVG